MNPSIFTTNMSPGELVKTEFIEHGTIRGKPDSRVVTGWAFIPDPLPPVGNLRDCMADLIDDYGKAVDAVGRLDEFSVQTPGSFSVNPWVLFWPLRLREARLSSRIENTVASAGEVALAEHIPTERSEPAEVSNYLNAVHLGAQTDGPITEALIRQLHSELLRGLPDSERYYPGSYRPMQAYIGGKETGFDGAKFVPPPPERVPHLMRDLVDFMRSAPADIPQLLVAGMAHYQFETIHPFADGNGRLGRMLITLSLCADGILKEPLVYPSAFIDKDKQRYYDSLYQVSVNADWSRWLKYFLEVVDYSARDTLERMRRLLGLRQSMVDRLEGRSHSPRILKAIDTLFESPAITAKVLHARIGGSESTARNYVDTFCTNGILKEVPGRQRDVVYVAHEILSAADED